MNKDNTKSSKTDSENSVFDDVDDPFEVETEVVSPELSEITIDPITGEEISDNDDEDDKPRQTQKQVKKQSSIETEIDFNDLGDLVNREDTSFEDHEAPDQSEDETDSSDQEPEAEKDPAPTPEELDKAKNKQEQKSRYSERVRELARQRREEAARREAAEEVAVQAQTQMLSMAETMMAGRIEQLEKDLKNALAAEEVDSIPALIQDLSKARIDHDRIKDAIKKQPEQKQKSEEQKAVSESPEAALDWLNGKEQMLLTAEYAKLPPEQKKVLLPMRTKAREIYNQLVAEDFDPKDASFYDEIDLRMGLEFPDTYDAFVNEGIDVVLSKSKSKADLAASDERTLKTNVNKGQKPSPKKVPVKPPGTARGPETAIDARQLRNPSSKAEPRFEDLSKEERRVYDTVFASRVTRSQYASELAKYKSSQKL